MNAQFVKNGSFEIANTNNLPRIIQGDWMFRSDFSAAGDFCWINRSIGDCQINPDNLLTPAPPNCFNWYAPTKGSPDYYHRYCNSTAIHVKVPDIKLPQGTYRELRQPYGYEFEQDQNAYCGILMYNSNPPGNNYIGAQYREYLQSQTELTLEKKKYYKISFKVSRSKSDYVNGYINKMGFYISPSPSIRTGDAIPLPATPQYQSDYPLISNADQNGLGGWTTIEGYFYDDLYDNNFITIGNFEQNTLTHTRDRLDNNIPTAYYFIDDVKIEELPVSDSCKCDSTFYKFSLDAKKDQTDENQCCYTFKLQVVDDEYGYSCPLMNFKIFAVDWNNPPNNKVEIYNHGQSIPWGTTINDVFCIPKDLIHEYWKIILVEFYDGNGLMESCSIKKEMPCQCQCNDGSDPKYYIKNLFKIIKTSQNDKCCYEVWFDNSNLPCHFNYPPGPYQDGLKYIHISKDRIQNDYSGFTFNSGTWGYREDVLGNNIWKGFERPSNMKIFPYDSPFLIGTFCHEADGLEHDYYIWVSYELPISSGLVGCNLKEGKFKCDEETQNCCQTLTVNLTMDVMNSAPGECFYILKVNQIQTPLNDCDVYSIKIFNRGDRLNPINIFNSQFQNKPLQLSNPSGTFIRYFLMGYQQEIHYDICFYGQQGQELCCFPIDAVCNSAPPGNWGTTPRSSSGDPGLTNNLIQDNLSDFKLIPNPSNGSINVMFNLKENCKVEIEIFDLFGRKVKTIFSEELSRRDNYKFYIDLPELNSGQYIAKIACNGSVMMIPFILIK